MRRSMRNFLLYAKEKGFSMSQIGALFHIYRGSGGVTDIGDDLGVTSAAASQMLERLVQQGFILRSESPQDRRVKQIILTDKGRQIIRESMVAREGWLEGLETTLSEAEKEKITGAIKLLIDKATQLDERQPIAK
ncbi:MAG: MarR family transcriptional regulator [Chloroflexi bacterium]|nr:MarR family transcriptional regulator [Chloroflexota bacterium]